MHQRVGLGALLQSATVVMNNAENGRWRVVWEINYRNKSATDKE
jgi:hypothetical protein